MAAKNPERKPFHKELAGSLASQMLQLTTAGFGLVAALAWNDAVKTFIEEYIKPYTAQGSVLTSQIIYALIVTLLAVLVTYQLTLIKRHFTKGKNN